MGMSFEGTGMNESREDSRIRKDVLSYSTLVLNAVGSTSWDADLCFGLTAGTNRRAAKREAELTGSLALKV